MKKNLLKGARKVKKEKKKIRKKKKVVVINLPHVSLKPVA
jgi:hypothetical protein